MARPSLSKQEWRKRLSDSGYILLGSFSRENPLKLRCTKCGGITYRTLYVALKDKDKRKCCKGKEKLAILDGVARSKGGHFLGGTYKDRLSKFKFCCNKNHTWNSTYNSVVNQGTWCPICNK